MPDSVQPSDESSELALTRSVRLLEVDPELGARLEGEELLERRVYATLPAIISTPGSWDIQQLRDARGVRGTYTGSC